MQAQRVGEQEVRQARWKFQRYFQGNKQRPLREAGEAIETLLVAYQKQEAWKRIASWYRQASGGQAPPSSEYLDCIATERAELYRCRPPEELRVPILVTPVEVEDRVPEEAEIAQVVSA